MTDTFKSWQERHAAFLAWWDKLPHAPNCTAGTPAPEHGEGMKILNCSCGRSEVMNETLRILQDLEERCGLGLGNTRAPKANDAGSDQP